MRSERAYIPTFVSTETPSYSLVYCFTNIKITSSWHLLNIRNMQNLLRCFEKNLVRKYRTFFIASYFKKVILNTYVRCPVMLFWFIWLCQVFIEGKLSPSFLIYAVKRSFQQIYFFTFLFISCQITQLNSVKELMAS